MIYTRQSFELRLATGVDLSEATSAKILYTKPNGATGEWTGTTDGLDITYTTTNTDILNKGVWRFQAYCQIEGLNKYGRIVKITIDESIL
jgi:hypothetical protein